MNTIPSQKLFIVLSILFSCALVSPLHAQGSNGGKDSFTGLKRWSFKTNTVEWLATIPNFTAEYDLSSSVYNRSTLSLGVKYNWNTHQNILPSTVFNILTARAEYRHYWRTVKASDTVIDTVYRAGKPHHTREVVYRDTSNMTVGKWFRQNVLSTERVKPKSLRAYYIGAYAEGGTYTLKLGEYGRQGAMYGVGFSLGYLLPMYEYRKGALNIELGFSLGLALTHYDVFTLNRVHNTYDYVPEMGRGIHLAPYPVISQIGVSFAWSGTSVKNKYVKVDEDKRRARLDRYESRELDRAEKKLRKKAETEARKTEKNARKEAGHAE